MLNLLMSVWNARIETLSRGPHNGVQDVEPQGYADDCCVTTTTPTTLRRAIEESETFAGQTGLLLAGHKCSLFVNEHGNRTSLEGIAVSGHPLTVDDNFSCLGLTISTRQGTTKGRATRHTLNALERPRRIALLPIPRVLRPRMIHGFFSSKWTYGCEHTDPHTQLDEKIGIETVKAAGYGRHMRCREIVNTLFLKGHIVGPTQARPYRLVNGLLDILLKDGPNKDRAIRLWHTVNPGEVGPIARAKRTLNTLQIPSVINEQEQSFANEALEDTTKQKILHTARDRIRRSIWRKAAERRQDMHGLEDMNYEKSSMLWRKKALNNHLQRLLEHVLSNAVWTRERIHRHTQGSLATSPLCTYCDTNANETPEHIYWECPHWQHIRQQYPQARQIYETTQHTVTKGCGLILRSEDNLHSASSIVQMQSMMATILHARYEANKLDALPDEPSEQLQILGGEPIRPHELEIHVTTGGEEVYRCRRCGTFRTATTQLLAQEHCDGQTRRRCTRQSALRNR